jgi:hypothetical protein
VPINEDPSLRPVVLRNGFRGLRPVGRVMKVERVMIAWDEDDDGRVTKVLVTDDFDRWLRENGTFDCSGGACYSDWCVTVKERSHNTEFPDQVFDPFGTFAGMLASGFATRKVMWEAVRQFAMIDRCDWARRMLFTLAGEWRQADIMLALVDR